MKTTIIANLDNLIFDDIKDITSRTINQMNLIGVKVVKVVMSKSFGDDFAKIAYDDNDFIISICGESNIKSTKKVFKLSANIDELDDALQSISHFVSALSNNTRDRVILKTFGLTKDNILSLLQGYISDDVLINIVGDNLDMQVVLEYDKELDQFIRQDIISSVYERLRNFIYTDENISIYQLAINLLNVNNKTLSIAEAITGGNIIKNLNSADKDNNKVLLGITAKDVSGLTNMLNLSKEQVHARTPNLVELVYEMAAGILEKSGSDLAIATLGDIDTNFAYIAVGDMDGIHVYKNMCNANTNQKVDIISKSAIYYLIKKIKQNDLFFDQIVV